MTNNSVTETCRIKWISKEALSYRSLTHDSHWDDISKTKEEKVVTRTNKIIRLSRWGRITYIVSAIETLGLPSGHWRKHTTVPDLSNKNVKIKFYI